MCKMKTVVISSNYMNDYSGVHCMKEIEISGKKIVFALVECSENNSIQLNRKQVLVKIKAFSCNYRDKGLMIIFNNKCNELSCIDKVMYSPFGSDFVAEVVAVGDEVRNLYLGDRVIPDCNYPYKNISQLGGIPSNFASQRYQVFEENDLFKIPETIPDDIAASFSVISQTAYSIIRKLKIVGDENILITSSTSNTSLALINALKSKNVNIYTISRNKNDSKYMKALGVKEHVSIESLDPDVVYKAFRGVKFDIAIDPFFDIYLKYIVDVINFGGKYVTCGLFTQDLNYPSHNSPNYSDVLVKVIMKNISIIGNCLGTTIDLACAIDEYVNNKYMLIIDSIYTGIDIVPFVEKSFGVVRKYGKVVFKYDY